MTNDTQVLELPLAVLELEEPVIVQLRAPDDNVIRETTLDVDRAKAVFEPPSRPTPPVTASNVHVPQNGRTWRFDSFQLWDGDTFTFTWLHGAR